MCSWFVKVVCKIAFRVSYIYFKYKNIKLQQRSLTCDSAMFVKVLHQMCTLCLIDDCLPVPPLVKCMNYSYIVARLLM